MLRLITDEDFNNRILRGLRRRQPDLDVVRVQDIGLSSTEDTAILEWAGREGRIVLTHDRRYFQWAYDRVHAGQPMPGVFIVNSLAPIGRALETLLFLAVESEPEDWRNLVEFLP